MRSFITLVLLLHAAVGQYPPPDGYEVAFADNFDGNSINLNNWQHEVTAWGGGNFEFEVYADDPLNSYVKNGLLHIKPTLLPDNTNPKTGQPYGEDFLYNGVLDLVDLYGECTWGENSGCYRLPPDIPPTMSARLRSYQKFSFKYGRVKIRAKMPKADWTWPAIWMLPEDYVYGAWPRSGEVDYVESIGNPDFLVNGEYTGIQLVGSTLHWGQSYDQNRYYLTRNDSTNIANDYASSFHIYELDWDENGLRFFLDGQSFLTVPNPTIDQNPSWTGFWDYGAPWNDPNDRLWDSGTLLAPFDEEFHILMNVAVGGTTGYIPDGGVNRGGDPYNKPWQNGASQTQGSKDFWDAVQYWAPTWQEADDGSAMQVDYVYVYQKV